MPKQAKDRVLIVDDDPDIRDLLQDQIFSPGRFEVFEARDGAEGLRMVEENRPDLIYIDLIMPSLSGKDMIVGIKAKNFEGPIIVGVKRGNEPDAIEAFRFGATDYITKPLRETEMMSVVQRALAAVRLRKERDQLLAQLKASNAALEERVKQLTTLSTLGKTLTAMQSLEGMFDSVLQGARDVTGADHSTLILQDQDSGQLILRAGSNMTLVMQEKLGDTIRDELAQLVMTSQEPLVVTGDGLRRFKLSRDILSTIYAPMVVHGHAIGVLTVGNHRKRKPFAEDLAEVVNALADYAAIAIMNARLFAALEQRAKHIEHAYTDLQVRDQKISNGLHRPLQKLQKTLGELSNSPRLSPELRRQLLQLTQQSDQMRSLVEQLMSAEHMA